MVTEEDLRRTLEKAKKGEINMNEDLIAILDHELERGTSVNLIIEKMFRHYYSDLRNNRKLMTDVTDQLEIQKVLKDYLDDYGDLTARLENEETGKVEEYRGRWVITNGQLGIELYEPYHKNELIYTDVVDISVESLYNSLDEYDFVDIMYNKYAYGGLWYGLVSGDIDNMIKSMMDDLFYDYARIIHEEVNGRFSNGRVKWGIGF